MPVDIFGSMGDDPNVSTTIQPIRNYALNLDDLENVEGFDSRGKRDNLYCFKLNKDKIYIRAELPPGLDNEGIEDKPLTFIFKDNKWIALPTKYAWELDMKLAPKTFSRKDGIMTIVNSGFIIGRYVSLAPSGNVDIPLLMLEDMKKYCIASKLNKEAHLELKLEIPSQRDTVNNPSSGFTIIIEGRTREKIGENEIIPGLLIATTNNKKIDFRIVIAVQKDKVSSRYVTPGIKVTQVENKTVGLNLIKIHDFYYICRVRLTTQPVSDNEIKYL